MTSQQFIKLLNQHSEVANGESSSFEFFMNLITEDLVKEEISQEQKDIYDSVFNILYEAKQNLILAKEKIKIAKEIINE